MKGEAVDDSAAPARLTIMVVRALGCMNACRDALAQPAGSGVLATQTTSCGIRRSQMTQAHARKDVHQATESQTVAAPHPQGRRCWLVSERRRVSLPGAVAIRSSRSVQPRV